MGIFILIGKSFVWCIVAYKTIHVVKRHYRKGRLCVKPIVGAQIDELFGYFSCPCAATNENESAFAITHFNNDDKNEGAEISIDIKGFSTENYMLNTNYKKSLNTLTKCV
ncbi:MAG: hypothetical protein IKV16_02680 [Clostridia bacterium]|nr:hypothetical protein [Clostridia bacterium]